MRLLISLLTLTAVFSASASDLPKNLLRYSSGALPMVQNDNAQWVSVNPESIDWNAPYAAVLAGDIGKTLDLTNAPKTFLVDLGQPEAINRFSMYTRSASGTITAYSSPVYEDPAAGNWTELGTVNFAPNQVASFNFQAEGRYLMIAFSQNSTGIVDSMGLFGNLTYADLRAPINMQPTSPTEVVYSLNYATPATSFNVVSVFPNQDTNAVWALFDDDPATVYNVTDTTTIIVDMGSARQIDSTVIAASTDAAVNVQFADSVDALNQSAYYMEGFAPFKAMGANGPINAQFAKITLTPNNGPFSCGGISFVGPVLPSAFVFNRPLGDTPADVAAPRTPPSGPPNVPPGPPQLNSNEVEILKEEFFNEFPQEA